MLKCAAALVLMSEVCEEVRALRIAMDYPLRITEGMSRSHDGRRGQRHLFDLLDPRVWR
jgi:hypothetical protein